MISRFHLTRTAATTLIALFGLFIAPVATFAQGVTCDGQYDGHLQGVATDGTSAIFWSFTVALVKTNMNGGIYHQVVVPNHHGDLVYRDGAVYVAVNLGQFNQEAGKADSWVYVYDASDLTLIARHPVPEVVHGAGGITIRDGHYFIVGGLPEGYTENYVYEYDGDFKFIKRNVIPSGYTRLGIQTACYYGGYFWFGCYGAPDNCALIRTDGNFENHEGFTADVSVGIDSLPGGKFLKGSTGKDQDTGKYWGRVETVTGQDLLKTPFVKKN